MSITVVGHWEQSYLTPLTDSYFWAYPLRDFAVTNWLMHPVTGIVNHESAVTLTEHHDFQSCLANVTGRLVFVEPINQAFPQTANPTWLHEYTHPDDAVYIFGSAHFNPMAGGNFDPDLHDHIAIATANNNGILWPHQALVTVLHDRLVKSWP